MGAWLVLGLGNPGAEYEHTRHNVGADTVRALAHRAGQSLRSSRRDRSLVAEVRLAGSPVVLAFPQTYMNDSGEAARLLARHHGIDALGRVIVVHDELDLEPGIVRVKAGGGLAGHNGLRSLKQHLHGDAFLRVRIGVGKPRSAAQGADHVLKRLSSAARTVLDVSVQVAADAVEQIVAEGVEAAMTAVNRREPPAPPR
ncbi:MAG: aminoacyl-tRNA hydrolase [Acidimicrobiales bacterium]